MTAPKITKLGDNITCIGDNVRVEPGPKMLEAVATDELLSDDNTAGHYFVGSREEPVLRPDGTQMTGPDGEPLFATKIGVDAMGKPIELGEPMKYLAWGGRVASREESFYVYTLVDGVWQRHDAFDTFEEAMAAGGALAAA